MSKTTGIGWTDSTANAVIGCSRVSPGCVNCYAEVDTPARVHRHRGRETWGAKGERIPVSSFEKNMLAMNRRPWICDNCGLASGCIQQVIALTGDSTCKCGCKTWHRRRIFADSNSDWLDEQWPIETLAHFLDVIRQCDQCIIQLLTKRPETFKTRMREVISEWQKDHSRPFDWPENWLMGKAPNHVWLGVSCEDQQRADERIPELLKIPAEVRFLSCEPLLGPIDLNALKFENDYCDQCGEHIQNSLLCQTAHCSCCVEGDEAIIFGPIDWVIVGGESGPNRRPMELQWLTSIVEQCKMADLPVYVKQDTALKPGQQGRIADSIWKIKQFPS